MLRSALTFVSAAALLLAGFTFAGRVIGLWDPVEPGDSGGSPVRVLDRPDFDAASRAVPPVVVHSKPSPPVSLRLALLIALVCLALSVLPTLARLPRRLEDSAWSPRKRVSRTSTGRANPLFASQLGGNLGLSRAPPAQQSLKELPSPLLRSRRSAAARLKNPRGSHRLFAPCTLGFVAHPQRRPWRCLLRLSVPSNLAGVEPSPRRPWSAYARSTHSSTNFGTTSC